MVTTNLIGKACEIKGGLCNGKYTGKRLFICAVWVDPNPANTQLMISVLTEAGEIITFYADSVLVK